MKVSHYFLLGLAVLLVAAILGATVPLASAYEPAPKAAADEAAIDKKIAALIKQLGADEYAAREEAQRQLAEIGQAAFDALFDAQDSDDVEIALRSKYLLGLIRFTWVRDGDPDAVNVLLRDYDGVSEPMQHYKMRELAELPNDGGVDALCRLARFEKSNTRSKYAALAIVRMEAADEKPLGEKRGEQILKSLAASKRDAAAWLRAYVDTARKPADAERYWKELIAKEQKLLDSSPGESDRMLIATMMQHQADLLERLGREKDSLEVVRKLFDFVDVENEATLMLMVDWLVRKRAWPVIDEMSKKFDKAFASNAVSIYTLAEARLTQDSPEEAEKLAEKAMKIRPDKDDVSLRYHLIIAHRLQERELARWAEREFRHVITSAEKRNESAILARSELAYMLHDLEREKEAADMLGELVTLMEADETVRAIVTAIYQQPSSLKARMHFYHAQHHAKEGKKAEQRAELDAALKDDATDGDVLIDLYNLTKADPAEHKKIQEKIKSALDEMRAKLKEEPDSATWPNQIAWLIANTEGDKEEALAMSLKSLEMRPNSGGLLDTLAHCYYALGQYDKAVATQENAVRLEPSSRTIKKKLDVFKAARDAAKKPNGDG